MTTDIATLERVLRSAKEKLTPEELKLLWNCKTKALREFTGGALIASAASYAASSSLHRFHRLALAGGAGYIGGLWCFGRSLDSCSEAILSLDGSRIQKELANIIVKTQPNNEWKMKHVARYFYSERVFDDSNLDMPKMRWRYRNFFSDTIADGQRSQGRNSDGESHDDDQGNSNSGSYEEPNKVSQNKLDGKSTGLHSKQASGSSSTEVVEDPLDCVFGSATTTEEVNHAATSSTSPRKPTRSNKRSQRKQRRRLREADMQAT